MRTHIYSMHPARARTSVRAYLWQVVWYCEAKGDAKGSSSWAQAVGGNDVMACVCVLFELCICVCVLFELCLCVCVLFEPCICVCVLCLLSLVFTVCGLNLLVYEA